MTPSLGRLRPYLRAIERVPAVAAHRVMTKPFRAALIGKAFRSQFFGGAEELARHPVYPGPVRPAHPRGVAPTARD